MSKNESKWLKYVDSLRIGSSLKSYFNFFKNNLHVSKIFFVDRIKNYFNTTDIEDLGNF
jgi:hypothetical protein